MARLAKSLETLRAQIDALAPGRDKSSDGWIASTQHHAQNPTSDHEADGAGVVHALDITNDPAHGVVATDLAEQLRQSRDPRIKYIISNRRIANPDVQNWAWRPYNGTNPHDKHFHTSVKADDALSDATTPWALELSAPTGEVSVARPVLQKGSKGPAVSEAQRMLGVTVDGFYGPGTELAVVSFQQAHEGLTADGMIGPYTWDALMGSPGVSPGISRPPADLFEAKAPVIMRQLMVDFPMRDFHAAGVLGNIGQESGGFTIMQQVGKTPPDGGWSWCQWDGVRRTAFDAWADQNGFPRDSSEAAYGFLRHELQTTEKGALNALLATTTIEDATLVFSRKFERPGIPHEDRRIAYAQRALAAYQAPSEPQEQPEPELPQQSFPFPFPIPGLPTAPSGGFPSFPTQQADGIPWGDLIGVALRTFTGGGAGSISMPWGNPQNLIAHTIHIATLAKNLRPETLTLEKLAAAASAGLSTLVEGQSPAIVGKALAPPTPLQLPTPIRIGALKMAQPPQTVVVPVVPATKSKINWTQAITGAGQLINLGMVFAGALPPKYGVPIAGGLGLASNAITWIFKTWFTTSVTPASVAAS